MDLDFLRHDKPLHPTRIQPHMKHVPKYLLPRIAPVVDNELAQSGDAAKEALSGVSNSGAKASFVPFRKQQRKNTKGRNSKTVGRFGARKGGKKISDPLKKFGR